MLRKLSRWLRFIGFAPLVEPQVIQLNEQYKLLWGHNRFWAWDGGIIVEPCYKDISEYAARLILTQRAMQKLGQAYVDAFNSMMEAIRMEQMKSTFGILPMMQNEDNKGD